MVLEEFGFPFDSIEAEDGTYDRAAASADWARYASSLFSNGFVLTPKDKENGFKPLKVTAAAGMTVGVDTGGILINGRMRIFSAQTLLTLDQADSLPRIDLICARLDLNAESGRKITCVVIRGEPAAVPVEPAFIRDDVIFDMVLAKITVPASVAKLTDDDISDLREFPAYCGRMMTSDASGIADKLDEAGTVKQLLKEYKTNGTYTWTVPEGVYYVDAFLMGGGGGTASRRLDGNTIDVGGGGAGYIKNIVKMSVTPGQQINVVVGKGGNGGNPPQSANSSSSGQAGGTTSFYGQTAGGGGAGGSSYVAFGEPGAGSSPGGTSGGAGITINGEYIPGQGVAAVNINDPGRRYGRGGKNGAGAAPECEVDVGSGGDGGRAANTVTGTAGKAGCVMIYGYVNMREV